MYEAYRNMLLRSYLARYALATLVYSLVVWASLFLVPSGGNGASLVWPPAAVGLALLFFGGLELWPALATGFFIVLASRSIAPPLIAITAIGNVAESVFAAYLLRTYIGLNPMFSRLRDTLGIIFAAVVATLVTATVVTLGVYLVNHQAAPSSALWVGLWVGHTVSLIAMGPFLLRWLHRPLFTKTSSEVVEGVTLFGSIFTLTILIFWTPYGSIGGISLLYVLIMFLIWAALRSGPRGTTLSIFILSAVGSVGTLYGYGPLTHSPNLAVTLFGIQMIIGVLSVIFLLFTSITEERKEAVNDLEGSVEKLQDALQKLSSEDKAKSDFIAILAHELRNPLSPILSGLEILKTKESGDKDVLHMMGAHLHSIARLLDDLLDISRISQKKFKLQKENVEMGKIVEHTLEMVRPFMATRNHTLLTHLPEKEIWLHGDPVRLSQILVNLLNNAARYTDPGGVIELVVKTDGSQFIATVKDSGIGIGRDRLHKVFEAFGGTEENGHRPGGLRIGLSLARRMAEMHHGSVSVMSEGEGKGSTFTVRIPLPPTMPLPLEVSEKERPIVRSRFSAERLREASRLNGARKVLVVDDNEAAAQGLATLLRHNGHDVSVAFDAPEALECASKINPAVAILDIGLPTMSGYELAKQMRARAKNKLSLIALTGYGQESDKQKAFDAGFEAHLIKPVSIVDVERVLADLTT